MEIHDTCRVKVSGIDLEYDARNRMLVLVRYVR